MRRAASTARLQIRRLQRVDIGALGECDLRLATKWQVLHRHAVCRIHVRRDDERAEARERLVGCEHIDRRTDLTGAQVEPIFGDIQLQKRVLDLADRCPFRKDCSDMKPKRRGQLKARQHTEVPEDPAIIAESSFLDGGQAF